MRNFCRPLLPLILLLASAAVPLAQSVTTPGDFFGFELGSDRKMARWDRMVEYFNRLDSESDRIRVTNMGPTTMGNPFLSAILTSPANFGRLEEYRRLNSQISDPRGVAQAQIEAAISQGKVVIVQSMSLHATEIGGSQMAPELAYDLATRSDEEALRILDNVIFFMFPSFNPDGQIMVTDWYRKYLGTEYEASGLPWLYHKYVGHDNNRDGDYLNMIESIYAAQIMYRDWKPQAYVDHHHMGSYGARFYVPPYSEPIRPYGDPLMWRELSWYGGHIAYRLEEAGKAGVLNAAQYPGWGHFGWHWITPFHNIAGMLTESASARLATPLFIHPDQLRGGARNFPRYEPQTNIPNPWPGGWWRLRDIVEQQKISAWAVLDIAARHRETVLRNAYLKAKRQTERGAEGETQFYVIPAAQHDWPTTLKMVNTLILSDVEIQQADRGFEVNGMGYAAGSFLIPLAQPKMGLIQNLLAPTLYPDNEWTRSRDGAPLRPYDSATHTMAEFMGVRVDPLSQPVSVAMTKLTGRVAIGGSVSRGTPSFRLDGRQNAAVKAVNLLLDEGVAIQRVDESREGLNQGDFLLSAPASLLNRIATDSGANFEGRTTVPQQGTHPVQRQRVGMYQRYRGGNMDEGWTRFLLEQFSFPYSSVMDAEIQAGSLIDKYDVLIFPHDRTRTIMGDFSEEDDRSVPPEYRSGIKEEGLAAIKAFVEAGGDLVALGDATAFAIEKFKLPISNVVASLDSKDFFCPGSTLKVKFSNQHPLAYGMPDEGLILFWSSPAFSINPTAHNEHYTPIVTFKDRDLLQSGWLIGEQHLAKKAAMISAQQGEGRIILIGFRTQSRAQTDGTFKLLFNTLIQ